MTVHGSLLSGIQNEHGILFDRVSVHNECKSTVLVYLQAQKNRNIC